MKNWDDVVRDLRQMEQIALRLATKHRGKPEYVLPEQGPVKDFHCQMFDAYNILQDIFVNENKRPIKADMMQET